MRRNLAIGLAFVVLAIAKVAEAHTYGATGAGLAEGFGHPLGGPDHLLAMIAVGLWAVQIGGRAIWLVPISFVVMMAFGGLAGMAGIPVPMVELGIAGSVLVLGSLVALSSRMPVWLGMAVVGLFAIFHGHAHGTEMPQAASATLYALGFVLATGLLHAVGIAAGGFGREGLPARLVRFSGATIAAVGVYLLAGF